MIIVTGIPGSGKTTLAKRLMQDVGVRGVAQDAVKEFLADHLGGTYTDQQSSALGRVTRRAVLELNLRNWVSRLSLSRHCKRQLQKRFCGIAHIDQFCRFT